MPRLLDSEQKMNLQENLYRLLQVRIAAQSFPAVEPPSRPSYPLEITAYSQLTPDELQILDAGYNAEVLAQFAVSGKSEYRQLFTLVVEYGGLNELAAFNKLIELEDKAKEQLNDFQRANMERPANKPSEFELVPIEVAQDKF